MKQFEKILHESFLFNPVENWLWFIGIIIVGFLFKRIFSVLLSKIVYRLIKQETRDVPVSSFVDLLKRPVEFIITLLIIYSAVNEISFPKRWRIIPFGKMRVSDFADKVLDTLFVIAITWIIIRLIKFFAIVFLKKAEENDTKVDEHLVPFFRDIIIALVVFCSFFLILGFVFRQDVISLITGLGIGGVALALAARATLENLFASFTLFTEQPFIVGDDVELDSMVGKIEKVGFRSTRIRHVDGSLVIVPNQMLVSQTLNNLTQRKARRHKFFLRLSLETPLEKVRIVIQDIQQLLDNHPETSAQEGHVKFDDIGEYSINLLVVFFAATPDYWESKTIREDINYQISKVLEKNGVEIAMPPNVVGANYSLKNIDDDY
ncbi:MscS Mechanosensitive ion channel [Emticicia oligotrophica DSM 17448]|uniref:MscS Mechanosensitive ion channel n=1 Tax=Emticicia oligotrophica (strain DSM 17448 / CIP 109782 / MTCC 6937 / GPTSA100-15) TaxID=929562 RepID=A0ABN4AS64_EMTOG|nr:MULTISPECIES: mechanosensitive ion channel domain-containing protein [Emticicia]AFK04796.1 MscS Mechanosensitive ion channel [Emticicia oligotrophica DSM 17448]